MSVGPVPFRKAHTVVEHWMSYPNIVMLDTAVKKVGGRETGEQAIVVGVIKKKSVADLTALDFPVPPAVKVDVRLPDGSVRSMQVPTDVIETGAFRPLTLNMKQRPCPGGWQIAAPNPSRPEGSGTLGVTTFYRKKRCLLTNCHVIGNQSGSPGLNVYQPGKNGLDSRIGVCDGTISVVSYYSKLAASWPWCVRNRYDFAWCHIPFEAGLTSHQISGGIYGWGMSRLRFGENWLLMKK
jgi:hypothetical protein